MGVSNFDIGILKEKNLVYLYLSCGLFSMSNEPFYKWKALKCIHIVPRISLRGFVKSKKEKPPKIFQQCNEEMLFAKCCLAFRDANQDK